jgi:glycine dehydrogenase subunit 1
VRYIPHTEADVREMLRVIGVASVDDLFAEVHRRFPERPPADLPAALGEADLLRHLEAVAAKNELPVSFAGGGIYDHHVPAAVGEVLARSEFYTAYTPYQPEVSQGTLQAAFEFQTLVCQLTGMEVANASMYDGASATAEAVLMARRITGRDGVILSAALHPEYQEVCDTYLKASGDCWRLAPLGTVGTVDREALGGLLDGEVAAVVVQSPNFFGCLEDLEALAPVVHDAGGLLVAAVTEPLAFALLRPPGQMGADIVCGEAQSLGIPMQFGGPGLGIFAAREAFLRQMPGRLIGQTQDARGRVGYVVTLATREQHIRRAKATSNICTNHFLCALAATVYLALMGRQGLRELAALNFSKTEYAKKRIAALPGYGLRHPAPTFNEFVVRTPVPAEKVVDRLVSRGIVPGLALGRYDEKRSHELLVCVTEQRTRAEIDALAEALEVEGRRG